MYIGLSQSRGKTPFPPDYIAIATIEIPDAEFAFTNYFALRAFTFRDFLMFIFSRLSFLRLLMRPFPAHLMPRYLPLMTSP